MYAVVYNNRVIVGPMTWNRAIFQGSLAKQKIQVQLPRVPPDTWPLVINDTAKIVPAQEQRPEMNPRLEYWYGPQWLIQHDVAIANYLVFDQDLTSAQSNLRALAAEYRYKKEVAGVSHVVQGVSVFLDTSREGRNIFVQKLMLMGDADVVSWKFPEAWLALTRSDLADVVAAGAAYIQSCFEWEKIINDQISLAQTKQDLIQIEQHILNPDN